ncbi:Bifunctional protein NCOAT [Papilio machaon]|uniref:Bifunctional protein NCOAT n=1 Tax=Papilio machaon TaxID=76193 RepID=A0A0N1PKI6_PAPMA|nr:Bifunctional protein NCOAT [Papilio machaon]
MVIEDDSGCIQHEIDTEVDVDDSEDKSESIAEVKLNAPSLHRQHNCKSKELKVISFAGIKPEIVGYACAALNAKEFYRKLEIAWIPEMCQKYPRELLQRDDLSPVAKECIKHFHEFSNMPRAPESVWRAHPALLACCVPGVRDPLAPPRLITCLLAALRANGK